jgi:hypothetical protein
LKNHLQSQIKSLDTAYRLWFFFGLHYAYLGKWKIQFLYWITLGGMGVWSVIDLVTLSRRIAVHNELIFEQIDDLNRMTQHDKRARNCKVGKNQKHSIKTKFSQVADPNRPYSRLAIDRIFTKTKATMQQAALIRGGDGLALYIDVYTGKTLRGGDPYDYEHIRSSEAVHSLYKSLLTDDQIALVVNCLENVGVTLSCINKSKGKRKMEDWLSNPANIVGNEIDVELTLANLKKADYGIERMVREFLSVLI